MTNLHITLHVDKFMSIPVKHGTERERKERNLKCKMFLSLRCHSVLESVSTVF